MLVLEKKTMKQQIPKERTTILKALGKPDLFYPSSPFHAK